MAAKKKPGKSVTYTYTATVTVTPSDLTPMGSLVWNEPEEARKQLLEVLRKNEGSVLAAAKELGVSRPTLYKWLERLELKAELNRMRESE